MHTVVNIYFILEYEGFKIFDQTKCLIKSENHPKTISIQFWSAIFNKQFIEIIIDKEIKVTYPHLKAYDLTDVV